MAELGVKSQPTVPPVFAAEALEMVPPTPPDTATLLKVRPLGSASRTLMAPLEVDPAAVLVTVTVYVAVLPV